MNRSTKPRGHKIIFKKNLKTVLTVELPVLIIPSLYKKSLQIIEIGQPWLSTADPSAELNARIRCRGIERTHSITKGCSLKRFRMFLKRLQEAILKGRVVGMIRHTLPFFLSTPCVLIKYDYSVLGISVELPLRP